MLVPTRCLSSYMTTKLLEFRNPQGREENWINGQERTGNRILFVGKVITTEIAASLLCVTAAIESIAYLNLLLGSLLLLPFTDRPIRVVQPLLSSSGFTLYWNLGNITVFNLFYTNVVTNEPFARLSMDHWRRGRLFKAVLTVAAVSLSILSLLSTLSGGPGGASIPVHNLDMLNQACLRDEDRLYLRNWYLRHTPSVQGRINEILQLVQHFGIQTDQQVQEGADFFKEHFLAPNKIEEASRQCILDNDPDIFVFALTRIIYLYVFGELCNAPLPNFLKSSTRTAIQNLRTEYEGEENQGNSSSKLASFVCDHVAFNNDVEDQPTRVILNSLKDAAYKELQNSLFLTDCWQKACTEYLAEHSL